MIDNDSIKMSITKSAVWPPRESGGVWGWITQVTHNRIPKWRDLGHAERDDGVL
jgi:hypothetical protein